MQGQCKTVGIALLTESESTHLGEMSHDFTSGDHKQNKEIYILTEIQTELNTNVGVTAGISAKL